jgi:hypothetical protein
VPTATSALEVVDGEVRELIRRRGLELPPRVGGAGRDGAPVAGVEQPALGRGPGPFDVSGEHLDKPTRRIDRSLGSVLGLPKFSGTTPAALHLSANMQSAPEEVDIS